MRHDGPLLAGMPEMRPHEMTPDSIDLKVEKRGRREEGRFVVTIEFRFLFFFFFFFTTFLFPRVETGSCQGKKKVKSSSRKEFYSASVFLIPMFAMRIFLAEKLKEILTAVVFPTTNGGMPNGSSVATYHTFAYTYLHVWCQFVCSVGALINKIPTLELSRKFIKSVLLVGLATQSEKRAKYCIGIFFFSKKVLNYRAAHSS